MHRNVVMLRPRSRCLLMRFDGSRPSVSFKDLHPSLKPVLLPSEFTPFPLPKYDESLGFGPTRVNDVNDIARAKSTMLEKQRERKPSFVDLLDEEAVAAPPETIRHSDSITDSKHHHLEDIGSSSKTADITADPSSRGYVQEAGYPLLDRLVCTRPLDDLLKQYLNHAGVEGKAAAINDLAHGLERFTNEELRVLFDTLASEFDPDGNGIQFFARRVEGYMLPFWVGSPVHWAFRGLLTALDEHFIGSELQRLVDDPTLLAPMLRFYSRVKIFQPNLWHSIDAHRMSNTTDSYGPKNHNRHFLNKNIFEELFLRIQELVTADASGAYFCSKLDLVQVVDLFSAFAAVKPDGAVSGPIADELLQCFSMRVKEARAANQVDQPSRRDVDVAIGRMYFATRMANITHESLDEIADSCHDLSEPLISALTQRRPKISKDRVEKIISQVAGELDVASGNIAEAERLGLLDSVRDLLLSVDDREWAAQISSKYRIGHRSLELLSARCSAIAKTLDDQDGNISSRVGTKRTPHIRTYRSGLKRLVNLVAINIIHSSAAHRDVTPIIAALRQGRTGRVSSLVTFQTLWRLHFVATKSAKKRLRERCQRALKALAFDISKGLVYFVPFEEEILLRDAGLIADEDVMVWTLAATLFHDAPMLKPRMLIGKGSEAERPYCNLKSSSHGVFVERDVTLSMNRKVINRDGKQGLASVFSSRELTMQARLAKPLMTKVKDRPSSIRQYHVRRSYLAFRRDRALFDKYHVHARNTLPGFGRGGATDHDFRGLGYHTPDHPQVVSQ